MQEVVITSAARTAVGSYGKSLKDIPTTELGATAVTAAMDRAGIPPEQVEQVVFGNVIHSAPEDMYMARVVGIKAGIPKETPAFTVNRLCGTGVQAIVSAAQTIQTGEANVVVAGGAESMSRGPYWMPNVRWGARMGEAKMVDPVVGGLTDPFHRVHMGITAENLAESHDISREQQDEFSVESHMRAARAQEQGLFDDEIVPVEVTAVENAQGVQLDWAGEAASNQVVLVLSKSEAPKLLKASTGTAFLVPRASLANGVGYCFAVTASTAKAPSPATLAAKLPEESLTPGACIRGASPDTIRRS